MINAAAVTVGDVHCRWHSVSPPTGTAHSRQCASANLPIAVGPPPSVERGSALPSFGISRVPDIHEDMCRRARLVHENGGLARARLFLPRHLSDHPRSELSRKRKI